jgi:EAL and modified HD-GYP domain-containing signal transduction protein
MGMFSMLDVLVGRPLREILDSVRLSTEVKNALLGMSSKYRDILELAMHYQTGNWEQFSHSVKKLSLSEAIIPKLYLESVKWADQIAGLKSSSGPN